MNTSFYIAKRYLFAKKSHNVINVISAICAIGMGVGTAALIMIMSVYNGFEGLIKDNLSDIDPHVLLTPKESKFFTPEDNLFSILKEDSRIAEINCVLEDNVFFTYSGNEGIAKARGVDYGYEEQSGLGNHIVEGEFSLFKGDIPMACVGATLAYRNGMHTRFLDPIELYYPDTKGNISLTNPAASLNNTHVWAGSIFSVTSTLDAGTMIIPLSTMQELTGNYEILSGIEIRLSDGTDRAVKKFIKSADIPAQYELKDRYHQNPSLYRMMKYEKFAIFMILICVVIIIAFNIFGSLSLLIIEKKKDCFTLRAMGAKDSLIRRIFVLEGWMVSVLGMLGGLVVGVALVLLQQRFGIVKMPGNYLVSAYPVVLEWADVLLSCAGVALIGLLIALPASALQRD